MVLCCSRFHAEPHSSLCPEFDTMSCVLQSAAFNGVCHQHVGKVLQDCHDGTAVKYSVWKDIRC